MPDRDARRHGDLHAGRLFLDHAEVPQQAVLDGAVGRVVFVIGLRAGSLVDVGVALPLAVLEQRIAHRAGIADECDRAGSRVMDVATGDANPPVVIVHEDGIAAQLIELAVGDRAVFRSIEEHGPAAIDRPIAPQQRFLHIHERAGRMAEDEAAQRHRSDRPEMGRARISTIGACPTFVPAALKLDQVPQADHFHRRPAEIHVCRRVEVQRRCLCVVKPFAGGVEFLEDVLDEAVLRVHAHLAVILPAALVRDFVFLVLAGDAVVVAAPVRTVHGMDEPADGIGPPRGPLGTERVGRRAVVRTGVGVEIRIAGHVLPPAVHEQLVDHQSRGRPGLEHPVPVRLPMQIELRPAADNHRLARCRDVRGSGIFRSDDDRLRQVVDAGTEHHRLGFHLPCHLLCRRKRPQRPIRRARTAVIASRADVNLRRRNRSSYQQHDPRKPTHLGPLHEVSIPSRQTNVNSVFHFVEFLILPQSGCSEARETKIRASGRQ